MARTSTTAVIEVEAVRDKSLARVGERLLLAARLVPIGGGGGGHPPPSRTWPSSGASGSPRTVVAHPLRGKGYDFEVPLLAADFVSAEEGTGLVHVAPSHGADDFELGARHGLEVPDAVAEDGHLHRRRAAVRGNRTCSRRPSR